MAADGSLYLGIDLSTQQLKAIIIDEKGDVLEKEAVHFDKDLPQFGTQDGAIRSSDGLTVSTPVSVWLGAMDILMRRLKDSGKLGRIRMIGGGGQQHGTVYWTKESEEKLANLQATDDFLSIGKSFARPNCPIWMDSSTQKQCSQLEERVGGAEKLTTITGSRAYHRFSGNQIAKIYEEEPEVYSNCTRISLVSSFACSLFTGKVQGIDLSDGSGMNILDIQKKEWNKECLEAIAPGLKEKLGDPVETGNVVGNISPHLVEKYGFHVDCQVLAFTGDNPASLEGLCLSDDDVALSLGTSDTVLFTTDKPKTCLDGHLFVHPYIKDAYMGMICIKNGSLTRERIRKSFTLTWEQVGEELQKTSPGNEGNIGFYFDLDEIIPPVRAGDVRFNGNGDKTESFSKEVELRALLEGQFITKRIYATRMGWSQAKRVILTGGASLNPSIQQLVSDIFGVEVHVLQVADSAALGGALRARHAHQSPSTCYDTFSRSCITSTCVAKPNLKAHNTYNSLTPRYEQLDEQIRKEKSYR